MQEKLTDEFDEFLVKDMDFEFHEFVNKDMCSLYLDTSFLEEWKK